MAKYREFHDAEGHSQRPGIFAHERSHEIRLKKELQAEGAADEK